MRSLAADALRGAQVIEDAAYVQRAFEILSLRNLATYAAAEQVGGLTRQRGADLAIAALLEMLAAVRTIVRTFADGAPTPATMEHLQAAARAIGTDWPVTPPVWLPEAPRDACLIERAGVLVSEGRRVWMGLRATQTGVVDGALPPVHLTWDPDRFAAFLNAIRTILAIGLGAVLCVIGNDSDTTLVLVFLASLLGVLSAQPNPSAAVIGFLVALPPGMILAAIVDFHLLPLGSGFVPFALAVAPSAFLIALAYRHPKTAKLGPALMIYFTLLLSPSNMQNFDYSAFLNRALHLMVAVLVCFLAFAIALPVRPRWRLFRASGKIVLTLRRTLRNVSGPAGRRPRRSRSNA